MRLAVLSDTHFQSDRQARVGLRRAGLADLLLLRAVHRLNRFVRPDLTVLLGDVLNDGSAPDADSQFQTMRRTLDLLRMPWLALPGNHDGPSERFHQHFPRPPETVDVAGVRFVCFTDPEEPGYNARRLAAEVARMGAVRAGGWRGPVILLQHVPVFPPGLHSCPYNYVNCTEVLAAMARSGVSGVIAGHYHEGFGPLRHGDAQFLAAPALCEAPFPYLVVDIDTGGRLSVERQTLAMPAELGLVDVHLHTHMAYCNENMDIGLATQLAADFGLADLRFTEHSGHLYFSRQDYGATCFAGGIACAQPADSRMHLYTEALNSQRVAPQAWGIEVDADYRGDPIMREQDLNALPFRVGALHGLSSLSSKTTSDEVAAAEFLAVLRRFLACRFDVLAHPFRVFRRAGRPTPAGLLEPTVRLLREHGTAAEMNFHTNEPDIAFVRQCLDAGVPLAFGSDAHNLYEIGEFFPHLELLRRAGYDGDPRDVLLRP
jgi:histidinol phosphatase-like PHP family hydrolase/predicted phosphodiesterase